MFCKIRDGRQRACRLHDTLAAPRRLERCDEVGCDAVTSWMSLSLPLPLPSSSLSSLMTLRFFFSGLVVFGVAFLAAGFGFGLDAELDDFWAQTECDRSSSSCEP